MLVEYDNARILITDQKLETIKDVMGILEAASKAGGPLVIIAEDVTVSSQSQNGQLGSRLQRFSWQHMGFLEAVFKASGPSSSSPWTS